MAVNRFQFTPNTDLQRKPTEQELRDVPSMTQAEMSEIMKSPEYRNSPLVRALVAESIRKSDPRAPHTQPQGGEPRISGDEYLARKAYISNQIRDPRYKTDAHYRYQVAEELKQLGQNDESLSPDDLTTPNQTVSVGISTRPGQSTDLQVRSLQRVQMDTKTTGPEAPARPVKEPFSSGGTK